MGTRRDLSKGEEEEVDETVLRGERRKGGEEGEEDTVEKTGRL